MWYFIRHSVSHDAKLSLVQDTFAGVTINVNPDYIMCVDDDFSEETLLSISQNIQEIQSKIIENEAHLIIVKAHSPDIAEEIKRKQNELKNQMTSLNRLKKKNELVLAAQ